MYPCMLMYPCVRYTVSQFNKHITSSSTSTNLNVENEKIIIFLNTEYGTLYYFAYFYIFSLLLLFLFVLFFFFNV